MPEPLGDVIVDILQEVRHEAEILVKEDAVDLLDAALALAKESLRALKEGKLPVSGPTIERKLKVARRDLKRVIEEELGEDDEGDEEEGDEEPEEGGEKDE